MCESITIPMCRALYLSDNEFEHLSPEIKNMKNLRILALRDNELVDIPQVGSASALVRAVSQHQPSYLCRKNLCYLPR